MKLPYTLQHLKQETANLMKKIELLEASKRFNILLFYPFLHTVCINFQFPLRKKITYIACVLFIPQEALGRRIGFMLLGRTATDRTTVGKECKQCSCKKGQLNKLIKFSILIFQFDKYLNPVFFIFRIRFTRIKSSN